MSRLSGAERRRERRVSLWGLAMKPPFAGGSGGSGGGDVATPASLKSIATARPDALPRVT
jgi:hypothetical protein